MCRWQTFICKQINNSKVLQHICVVYAIRLSERVKDNRKCTDNHSRMPYNSVLLLDQKDNKLIEKK